MASLTNYYIGWVKENQFGKKPFVSSTKNCFQGSVSQHRLFPMTSISKARKVILHLFGLVAINVIFSILWLSLRSRLLEMTRILIMKYMVYVNICKQMLTLANHWGRAETVYPPGCPYRSSLHFLVNIFTMPVNHKTPHKIKELFSN